MGVFEGEDVGSDVVGASEGEVVGSGVTSPADILGGESVRSIPRT